MVCEFLAFDSCHDVDSLQGMDANSGRPKQYPTNVTVAPRFSDVTDIGCTEGHGEWENHQAAASTGIKRGRPLATPPVKFYSR